MKLRWTANWNRQRSLWCIDRSRLTGAWLVYVGHLYVGRIPA